MKLNDKCRTDEVKGVTREILELKARTAGSVELLADIGERLERAKSLLPKGCWISWLAEHVEVSRQAAWNYMRLAQLRAQDPARFHELAASGLRVALMSTRLTSNACPTPERAGARIERLAERVACVQAATPEAKARALEAVGHLRQVVSAWSSSSDEASVPGVPGPSMGDGSAFGEVMP